MKCSKSSLQNLAMKKELVKKVKEIFGKRYGRVVLDQEAEEIMVNLTNFMEVLLSRDKCYTKPSNR